MKDLFLMVGPPGTGKTTQLLSFLEGEIEVLGPARVSLCTFTRDATREAIARIERQFGFEREQLPWVRTIHSIAYRLLGLDRKNIMTSKAWHEFAERYSYAFSDGEQREDEPYEPPRQTEDDVLRAAHDWGRVRRLSPAETASRWPASLDRARFAEYVTRYEGYKAETGKLDFTDMLEEALVAGNAPPVDVAAVDEAQDLSPLQIEVVGRWFSSCERVYVAGDDDQAIFSFAGADPAWMIALSKAHETAVLDQSHRVPARVHQVADRIISRNRRRIPKTYRARAEAGEVDRLQLADAVASIDGVSTFVLARNKCFLESVARDLLARWVPYVLERGPGPNPLGSPKIVRAVATAASISRNENISADDLSAFLEFVPSTGGAVKRGFKTRVKEKESGLVSPVELRENMPQVLDAMRLHGPVSVMLRRPQPEREYLQRLLDRNAGRLPKPHVRLTTIHGSKGREADTVVVIPDMARASFREYMGTGAEGHESENRVAYVAVTRAKRRLVLCEPESSMAYEYPRYERLSK